MFACALALRRGRAYVTPTAVSAVRCASGTPLGSANAQKQGFAPDTRPMLPPGTFDGKTALITGGGTGLGLAMARMLSHLGANVAICSRSGDVVAASAKALNEEHKAGSGAASCGEVIGVPCDVRDPAAVAATYDAVVATFGATPNVVVNNAAGNFVSPSERLSPNAFGTVVDIVLKGTANTTLEGARRLREADAGGVFLSISTTYAETGSAFVVPSAAAKAGVNALIKSLSAEWGKYGLRFVGIAPGPIETKGAFSRLDPTGRFREHLTTRMPAGRLGEAGELANLAAYLCSDYANWCTGEIVALDGGEQRGIGGAFNALSVVSAEEWEHMAAAIRKTKGS